MRIWRKIVIFLMLLLFLAGLAVLCYPILHGAVTDRAISQEAQAFLEKLGMLPSTPEELPPEETEPPPTEPPVPYAELLAEMTRYNEALWSDRQKGLADPWSYTQPSFSLGDYGIQDEVFGVISIPALDLSMPIYLGATEQHMALGAAHLTQTSLPIGGSNTNCVLAGHRGYNGASYFRYITDLRPGDAVTVTNLWGELRYTVVDTKIIAPDDVNEILIQDGRELLTLLTCHPYASHGRQRYVVYCERNLERN